ncbi:MAG: hypothetical protein IIB81_03590, partial [Nanoarchaeota archaeon]|nr:hypothetical protein [Nanoarchaeota archaeon]
MSKKKVFLLVVSLVLMSLSAGVAYAAIGDSLSDIFKDFSSPDVYEKYYFLIDGIIYFLFFLSVTQVSLEKQFPGRSGKGIVIAAGLALTIGAVYWTQRTGFMLWDIFPFAIALVAIVFIIWIFRFMTGSEKGFSGILLVVIIGFIVFYVFFQDTVFSIDQNKTGRPLLDWLGILFFIVLVIFLFSRFKVSPSGGTPYRDYGAIGAAPPVVPGTGAVDPAGAGTGGIGGAAQPGGGNTATVGNITINVPGPGTAAPTRARRATTKRAAQAVEKVKEAEAEVTQIGQA